MKLNHLSLSDQVTFWRTQYDVILSSLVEMRDYRTVLLGQLRQAEADRDFHIARASEYRGELSDLKEATEPNPNEPSRYIEVGG